MQLQAISALSMPQTIEQIMRSDIGYVRMNPSLVLEQIISCYLAAIYPIAKPIYRETTITQNNIKLSIRAFTQRINTFGNR